MKSHQINKCRICKTNLNEPFLSLGYLPPANNLPQNNYEPEDKYPLELVFCNKCKLVQLNYVVNPEKLFTNYLYSSTSGMLENHFIDYAKNVAQVIGLTQNSVLVDIGSNDGLLLECFKKHISPNVIGVDPSINLAEIANLNNIKTYCEFFSYQTVKKISEEFGKVDLITANNVFAHIEDITNLTINIRTLLKDNGVFVIEVPYLNNMIEIGTFDLVYHEHLSYFSITPLHYFFDKLKMNIFKIEKISTHGGSVRIFIQKNTGIHPIDNSVKTYLNKEKHLNNVNTYQIFNKKIKSSVDNFKNQLISIRNQGNVIAGYAAPAKASTLLGYSNIDNNLIEYIVDDNPLKQGRFLPGTCIPIVNTEFLKNNIPDYFVILAWNLEKIIKKKLKKTIAKRLNYIVPFVK